MRRSVRINLSTGPQSVWLDSEQYKAILRTRLRKYLRRKNFPTELVRGLKTLSELRAAANIAASLASRKAR